MRIKVRIEEIAASKEGGETIEMKSSRDKIASTEKTALTKMTDSKIETIGDRRTSAGKGEVKVIKRKEVDCVTPATSLVISHVNVLKANQEEEGKVKKNLRLRNDKEALSFS